jgi:CubicO group peptidase (beta-lactamase class C family)
MKLRAVMGRITLGVVLVIGLAGVAGYLAEPEWVEHWVRSLLWGDWDTQDHTRFPARPISNAGPVFEFKSDMQPELFEMITDPATQAEVGFDEFLAANQTTAFIVVRDDAILYEQYFNGSGRDSINTSFSIAKSFLSTLIGIAIDEGHIRSVKDPVTDYVPELRGRGLDAVTIRHLLDMSSGIRYQEADKYPRFLDALSDEFRSYYFPNLRRMGLEVVPDGTGSGELFHYNNLHPLLLGLILERTTGQSVSAYLEEKLWRPLGMEYPASWSLDSERSGFELMGNGINARSIDYARFGRLMLHGGSWRGRQLVPVAWVAEATQPDPDDRRPWQIYQDFQAGGGYYKYLWWGHFLPDGTSAFFALGKHGQLIYIYPSKNLILVRNGPGTGNVASWPDVLRQVAGMIP